MQHDQDEAHLMLIQLKQTGHWIKKQTQHLRSQSRGQHFDKALRRFYADVLAMCANSESCVNHIHLTAILGGLAKAWAAADVCHVVQTQQQAVEDLHRFTAKILALLQPVCKALRTREASNLLLSLATLSIDPSSMVPGTLDAIAQQLLDYMDYANMQDLVDVLMGCSMLDLTPCCEDLVRAVSRQLAVADLSHVWSSQVATIAQSMALAHSLATIPSDASSIKALDALCERFGVLLRSHQAAERPSAQSIASFMWALSKIKYAPSQELAMSMVGRMVSLRCLPRKNMSALIGCVLLACAQLRLLVKQTDIESLVSQVLSSSQHQVDEQAHTNTAWSLAVLGWLHNQLFDTLLDRLSLPAAEVSVPSRLEDAGLGQLYQALDWLQPSPSASANEQEAWSSLQGKLRKLGPRPTPTTRYHGINSKLCSALEELQLSFRAKVVMQSYGADAVIESQGNKAQPIILSLGGQEYIKNRLGR